MKYVGIRTQKYLKILSHICAYPVAEMKNFRSTMDYSNKIYQVIK